MVRIAATLKDRPQALSVSAKPDCASSNDGKVSVCLAGELVVDLGRLAWQRLVVRQAIGLDVAGLRRRAAGEREGGRENNSCRLQSGRNLRFLQAFSRPRNLVCCRQFCYSRGMVARDKMNCSRCGKRLSRKSARMIDGKLLCSPCVFDAGRVLEERIARNMEPALNRLHPF